MNRALFHRDFTLVVIGQIISLFGNAVLRMLLPLYLLEQTGSPGLFSAVSAISFIPMILLSPIGGLIADRVNKRTMMVVLDFGTSALIVLCGFLLGRVPLVALLVPVLVLLYGIQGAYQPAVQASIPLLQEPEQILPAGAVINQVNALASLLGPALGGICYTRWGLRPVLFVCVGCFFVSAVMEIFIHMPHTLRVRHGSLLGSARDDLAESIRFIRTEKPILSRVILLAALFNLLLSALMIVGLPILVTTSLGLSADMLGFAQGMLAAGGLLGGILAGVFAQKLHPSASSFLLVLCAGLLVPIGLAFLLPLTTIARFLILCVASFALMACSTLVSIQFLAFVQLETPAALVGKVIACLLTISMSAQPIGQAVYGQLFEHLPGMEGLILLFAAAGSALVAIKARTVFAELA